MAGSRMIELAEKLLERAQEGNVAWSKALGKDSYMVRFPDMAVAIARLSWLPGPPSPPPGLPSLPDLRRVTTYGFRLELFDESGAMIGSLAATAGDPEHRLLSDIYHIAEAREGNIEAKIDKALEHLEHIVEEEPESEIEGFIAESEELRSQ